MILERPARVQVSETELSKSCAEKHSERQNELGANAVFNTWHRKWAGSDKYSVQHRSQFRCNLENDSGVTKSKGPYFCLWFARGCCHRGSDCFYLHRKPEPEDAYKIEATTDCFGRMKFAEFRDDMSGVGSFLHPCSTLFIGYFSHDNRKKTILISQLREQFSEWGTVTSVRLDNTSSFAFITFSEQLNAEFAKEAMSNQTVTGKETLLVKWAHTRGDKDQCSSQVINERKIRDIVRAVLRNKHSKSSEEPHSEASKEVIQPHPKDIPENDNLVPKNQQPLVKKRRGLVDY